MANRCATEASSECGSAQRCGDRCRNQIWQLGSRNHGRYCSEVRDCLNRSCREVGAEGCDEHLVAGELRVQGGRLIPDHSQVSSLVPGLDARNGKRCQLCGLRKRRGAVITDAVSGNRGDLGRVCGAVGETNRAAAQWHTGDWAGLVDELVAIGVANHETVTHDCRTAGVARCGVGDGERLVGRRGGRQERSTSRNWVDIEAANYRGCRCVSVVSGLIGDQFTNTGGQDRHDAVHVAACGVGGVWADRNSDRQTRVAGRTHREWSSTEDLVAG